MKSAKLSLYAGIALLVLAVVGIWIATNRDQQSVDPAGTTVQAPSQPQVTSSLQPAAQPASADSEPLGLAADSTEFQQVRQQSAPVLTREEIDMAINEIEEAATTYDPEELPVLESYLYDPDPEIRAAALDGMVTLGDSSASPMLRKAAQSAYTPQEAVAMLEAADYLDLPSGKLPPIDKATFEARQKEASDARQTEPVKLFKGMKSSPSTQ